MFLADNPVALGRDKDPRVELQIIGVAADAWDGQWMNRQHLMWALKDYAPVLYVQEPEPWWLGHRPRDERFLVARLQRRHASLSVLRLPKVLCRRSAPGTWNRMVTRLKAATITRHTDGTKRRVLYFWDPVLWPYVRALDVDLAVFHVYDLCDEYHKPALRSSPIYTAFCRACEAASFVVAGTEEQAQCVPRKEVVIIPNGVHSSWYTQPRPVPQDMESLPRPRIGYIGKISNKVDLGWLEALSMRRGWHIVLVGPLQKLAPPDHRRFELLCSRPNVHYLGSKAAQDIPAYMQALDVGLMCYTRGLHCEGSSPLKLYEYSAAGIPVVGSRLGSLHRDPEISQLVRLVDTPEEAVHAVSAALDSNGDTEARRRRIDFAERNSWARRAETVMRLVTSDFVPEEVCP